MAAGVFRVALTGGIATGKSHCLRAFGALGVPVIDADEVARDVVAPGTPALARIRARFGPGVVGDHGALDRARLGRIVFADADARADLEAIVHPAVYDAIEAWFGDRAREAGRDGRRVAIADVPLLYETGRDGRFDRVVAAVCDPAAQLARLMARDGLDESEARQRIAAQWPAGEKARRAHYVIDTSGAHAATDRQVLEVWERLRAEAAAG